MSAVERLVSKDDLVIADGMNYIKGFRYQLYCVARAISTPHCVVSLYTFNQIIGRSGTYDVKNRYIVEHPSIWHANGIRRGKREHILKMCM